MCVNTHLLTVITVGAALIEIYKCIEGYVNFL